MPDNVNLLTRSPLAWAVFSITMFTMLSLCFTGLASSQEIAGRIAFTSSRDGNNEIYSMNADGSAQTRLTNNSSIDLHPDWSPDGSLIAFTSSRNGNNEIYSMNADGSAPTRLTNNAANDESPVWSPDGSRIAFTSVRDGNAEIYLMNADGSEPTRLTNDPAVDNAPDWSPDGTRIAFHSSRDGNYEIYVMNTIDAVSPQTNLTNNSGQDLFPDWSPDGSRIAFHNARDNGNWEVYVMDADGGAQTRVTNSPTSDYAAVWRPATRYFFTWYDEMGGDNWVLMSNPVGAGNMIGSLSVVGGAAGYNDVMIPGGNSKVGRYPGIVGGPVVATSETGAGAIVSQRILWPNGGNSLEEVPGMDAARLSSHIYWSWYDESLGSGFKNWVLIANPQGAPLNPLNRTVHYEVKIGGAAVSGGTGTVQAGKNVIPRFPGLVGGPVEVRAWYDAGRTEPARVMASQRVLSNGETAFNELVGTPAEELSDHYLWTWYDDVGGANWILVANPGASAVNYTIKIAGQIMPGYNNRTLAPGQSDTPRFGIQDGPVEIIATGPVLASQRVIWGPSFAETPGMDYHALASTYHWTWYDQQDPGVSNWVIVANASTTSGVYYKVFVAGVDMTGCAWLAPSGRETPSFPGLIGGPVEVRAYSESSCTAAAPAPGVMASQRVLWRGYFNEVPGTVLD